MLKLKELNTIIKRSAKEKIRNVNSDTTHYSNGSPGSYTLCGKFGYQYIRTFPANESPVNCKLCLRAMAGLLKQKGKLIQNVTERKIPETCQIIRTIKTSDGKIFSMDRIEDVIKHEAVFLETFNTEKRAKKFVDSVDYIIRDIEAKLDQPRQQLTNLYISVKEHHFSRTSDSRKEMLKALYYFLAENRRAALKIARKYRRISKER